MFGGEIKSISPLQVLPARVTKVILYSRALVIMLCMTQYIYYFNVSMICSWDKYTVPSPGVCPCLGILVFEFAALAIEFAEGAEDVMVDLVCVLDAL